MLVIGLTGGIGTGKSEVARLLAGRGARVIGADQVGHEAYRPNSEIWREVVDVFGKHVLNPNGEIDRKKLGDIAFSSPGNLFKLNKIMHPLIARIMAEKIERFRAEGVPVVVLEAALLFEAGWDQLADEVWVTDSSPDLVMERLHSRNGLSEGEIQRRIRSQMPPAERIAKADAVIENSGDLQQLEHKVKSLWNSRVARRVGQNNNGS